MAHGPFTLKSSRFEASQVHTTEKTLDATSFHCASGLASSPRHHPSSSVSLPTIQTTMTSCAMLSSVFYMAALSTALIPPTIAYCASHMYDVMSAINKIAAIETTTAIWEFNPLRPNNQLLGDSLDMIVVIETLTIKVHYLCCSLSL
jgi:hypothetical protein